MLRKIVWPKRDEVTGEWRRIYKGELYDVYSSKKSILKYKIQKNEIVGVCRTCGEEERYTRDFVGES